MIKMLSYRTFSEAELERWVYSTPQDWRAFDEVLARFSIGEEKYTQDELDDAVEDAERAATEDQVDECPHCGESI
jgi:hypothetical protein